MTEASRPSAAASRWDQVAPWLELAGESRVNLLRIIGVAVFYAVHLVNRFVLEVEGVDERMHVAMTALAVAWMTMSLSIYLLLSQRIFPRWLPFASIALDHALMVMALLLADGPRSPLIALFYLLLAASALRFRVRMVGFATLCSMVGWIIVFGQATYFRPELAITRQVQITHLAALLVLGLIAGTLVLEVQRTLSELAPAGASEPAADGEPAPGGEPAPAGA